MSSRESLILTFGMLNQAGWSVQEEQTLEDGTNRECVKAMTKSHLCSPRSRADNSFPTSAMSLYTKFSGHPAIVAIHSLWYARIVVTNCRDDHLLLDQPNKSNAYTGPFKDEIFFHGLGNLSCDGVDDVAEKPRLKDHV